MESLLQEVSSGAPLRVVFFLTALTLLPAIVISMTAFLRIVLVLGLLRVALGLQQMPPNQVIIGLALFLTYFVMGSTFDQVEQASLSPYMAGQIDETQALERGAKPMHDFMLLQTRGRDLAMMANLAKVDQFNSPEDVPMRVLVPAYVVSELRAGFSIGFLLFIPFLVIDLAVAAMLNALGMIMLPPTAIALPFKLLIFVLADGWAMMVGSLVQSFGN